MSSVLTAYQKGARWRRCKHPEVVGGEGGGDFLEVLWFEAKLELGVPGGQFLYYTAASDLPINR